MISIPRLPFGAMLAALLFSFGGSARAEAALGENIVSVPNIATHFWFETFEPNRPFGLSVGGGLLLGGSGSSDTLPRLGYDRVIAERLSLGFDLFIGGSFSSAKYSGNNASAVSAPAFALGGSPRFGVLVPLGDTAFALWPRIGFSLVYGYARMQEDSAPAGAASPEYQRVRNTSTLRIPLNAELLLTAAPFRNVAVCVGVAFRRTVHAMTWVADSSSSSSETVSMSSSTELSLSLSSGLMVFW